MAFWMSGLAVTLETDGLSLTNRKSEIGELNSCTARLDWLFMPFAWVVGMSSATSSEPRWMSSACVAGSTAEYTTVWKCGLSGPQ